MSDKTKRRFYFLYVSFEYLQFILFVSLILSVETPTLWCLSPHVDVVLSAWLLVPTVTQDALVLTCTNNGDFARQLGLLYVSCTKSAPNSDTGGSSEP